MNRLLLAAVLLAGCASEEREPIDCLDLANALVERALELNCDPGDVHYNYLFSCTLFGQNDLTQEIAEGCLDAQAEMTECPTPYYPPQECFW